MAENSFITDEAKAALSGSGVVFKLREAVYADKAQREDVHALEGKAQAIAENLQDLIVSGQLDDSDTQKLNAALSKLRGAMAGGVISREALAMALSEAATAIGSTEGNSKNQSVQKQMDQLWQKIEQSNKDIDGDFEKMRKEGIVFDGKLWKQHKELSEYLQANPQDIDKQKELDAVDDKLLEQAEPQLKKHLNAKPHLEDAKQKSKERHEMVDHDLAVLKKKTVLLDSKTNDDWNVSVPLNEQGKDANLNDIERPNVGQKTKSTTKALSL